MFDLIRKEFNVPDSVELRMLEIIACKVNNFIQSDTKMDAASMTNTSGNKIYRVEPVPADQKNLIQDLSTFEVLIPVAQYHRDVFRCYGTPFMIKVTAGEKVGNVKERIRTMLNVPEKEFSKWKMVSVTPSKKTQLADDEQTIMRTELESISKHCNRANQFWIGLDHVEKSTKRVRSGLEKSLKIFN